MIRRLWPAVMPLLYVAFTLLVFWRIWTPIDGGQAFWRFDPRFEYWGDLIFQAETLRDGALALWNPWDRGGFPLYGDPQPGMLYPGNWPIVLWGVVAGDLGYPAIGVKILAHWAFGCIGMHLLLRRLGLKEQSCYVGGLLVGFTCPRVRYSGSALNWSFAWIPWVLLATHWFAERPSTRRAVVLGSAFAMVLLAGAPAVVLYALIICVPFGIWMMWGRIREHWKPIAVAAGVALLWLLPLVLSNIEQVPESVREQRNLRFIAHSAYSPGHLIGLLVPRVSHQNVYFGAIALLAVGAAIASPRRGLALLMLGVGAAGILLAFGTHAGVLPATASAVPVFGLFRQAHRYVYVTATVVPILAALGVSFALTVEDDEKRKRLARWLFGVGAALAFALLVAWLVSVVGSDEVDTAKNNGLALGVVSAGLAAWLVPSLLARSEPWRSRVGWIVVAVVALDVWTANSKVIDTGFDPPPETRRDGALARLEGTDKDWRVYDWGYLDFRPGTRLEIRDFGGYEDDPLGLSRYKLLLGAAKKDRRLLAHANVRYFLDGENRRPNLRPPPGATQIGEGIYELPDPAPAVFYIPDPQTANNPTEALAILRTLQPGEGAVVEGATPPAGPKDARPTAGRIVTLEPNRMVAEIETPGPGLVVVAEAYYPAWEAEVDGNQVPIQPANVMFRGVPVESAGAHRIEMTLRPMRFWGALPFYAAALGLLLYCVIGPLWARRRRSSRDRSSRPPSSDPPTEEGST